MSTASLPIPGRFIDFHPDHLKVIGADQLGLNIDPTSDIEVGSGFGSRIKGTLAGQYTFTLAPRSSVNPTTSNDLCRKAYVDALVYGLSWKVAVAARATGNITLGGLQTLDGYTLQSGDRVLAPVQTVANTSGIYIADASGWVRASDYATGEASGATVHVRNGTTYGNTTWTQTGEGTIGSVNQVWALIQGATVPTAGDGLLVTGSTWSVKLADGSLSVGGAGVAVRLAAGGALALVAGGLTLDITGLTEETVPDNNDLIVIWDNSTSLFKKMKRVNWNAGLVQGSTKFAEYSITGGDITAKQATITGVAGNTSIHNLVFLNGIQLQSGDATLNPTTGVLAWTGLSLDGRVAAGDKVQVWGHN